MWSLIPPALAQVTGEVSGLSLGATDPRIIVARIIQVALGLLGIVVLALILYGGFSWMTAAGDEEKIAKAKRILTNAVIGLAIILSAFAIASFVLRSLQRVTEGPGEVELAGGGATPGVSSGYFLARNFLPKGEVPIRNIVVRVEFNRPVDPASVTPSSFQVEKISAAGARPPIERIAGTLTVRGGTVEFRPEAACPPPNEARQCFDADTWLVVSIDQTIRSMDGRNLTCNLPSSLLQSLSLGSVGCSGEFRAGNRVDVSPPTVTIESPDPGASVAVDTCVPVQARVRDDGGIAMVEFYADGTLIEDGVATPQGTTSPTEAILSIPCWPTSPPAPSTHTLTAKAYDIDDNSATSRGVSVTVRPLHCFNGTRDDEEDAIDCDSAVGGPSGCGLCEGAVCRDASQCASGACINGRCATPTTITGVSPGDGRAGTLVTVAGLSFGTAPGTVTFTDDRVASAPASCAGATTWSDNYALVGVPEAAVSGPVTIVAANCAPGDTLCRDATDDERGPIVPLQNFASQNLGGQAPTDGSFWINEVTHPGLCAVTPSQGRWGTTVELRGVQFGASQGNGNIFFGEVPGAGVANWSDQNVTTAVPPVSYGTVPVQLLSSENIPSNSLPFQVLSPDGTTLPELASITPADGGPGTGITLAGRNFGATPGMVWFISSDGTAAAADVSLPLQCGTTWWTPTTITVKVPGNLEEGTFRVYVHRYDGQQSNTRSFEVTGAAPGPFLACIRPLGGPRLGNVTVYGERLGSAGFPPRGLYFTDTSSPTILAFNAAGDANPSWIGALATPTNTGGVSDDSCPSSGWSSTEVCAQVPSDARTGQLLLEQDIRAVTRRSNPLSFTIGSCRLPAGDPLHLDCGSFTCCPDGSCNSACGASAAPSAAYGWQFSTAEAARIPRVLERCDQTVGEGHPEYPPSPTPASASGRKSDTDVCTNAMVAVSLSTPLTPTSLNAQTVRIEKCTGAENIVSGTDASFGGDTTVWGRPPPPSISGAPDHEDLLAVGRVQGQGRGVDDPRDRGNYALRLEKLDDDTGPGWPNVLGIQQNYEHWFGYQANLALDTNGTTYTATAWMRAGSATALRKRAGILIQRGGGDWKKASAEITLSEAWQPVSVAITFDAGPNSDAPGFIRVFVEGLPYDIRVPEPDPDPLELFSVFVDDVQVVSDPCRQIGPNLFASGSFEPDPGSAGFRFWPSSNFEPGTWYRVTLIGGEGGITASGDGGEPMESTEEIVRHCGAQGAAYCFRFKTKDEPIPEDNLCAVGGISVVPSPWTARQENERIDYAAIPTAAGDPCIAPRPDSYGWSWSSTDPAKATVSYNPTSTPPHVGHACGSDADCAIGRSVCSDDAARACRSNADCAQGGICTALPACSGGFCQFMGWTTTATALEETDEPPGYVGIEARVGDVEGLGRLSIEFAPPRILSYWPRCGAACTNAAVGAQFSHTMVASPANAASVINPANVQVWSMPCGNGQVEAGEDCDDGNTTSGDGCSSVCLNEGSNYPVRCGNSTVDSFEDCDDGNLTSGDGCSARCLNEGGAATCGNGAIDSAEDCDDGNATGGDGCSANCLNEGTRSDLPICGNRRLERGEECEASLDGALPSWCDSATCLRQGPDDPLSCGNGVIDPGEECDPNSGMLDTESERALCNSQCQWTGTLRPSASGGQGCGNSRIEIGEDCDDGNLRPADGCDEACRNEGSAPGSIPACGNSAVDAGEDCDDGNVEDGDGCSARCLSEGRSGAVCGNGVREPGEDCDRGILGQTYPSSVVNAICSSACVNLGTDPVGVSADRNTIKPNTCGNGVLNDGEDCDGGAYCTSTCLHATGRPPQRVVIADLTLGWDSVRRSLDITPRTPLSANSFYRVMLRGDEPATEAREGVRACRGPNCVSGKSLEGLNFRYNWGTSTPPEAQSDCTSATCNTFSWTFKTGESTCGIERVELSPARAFLYVIGARAPYSTQPFGPPDTCDPAGQRLNPFVYNWAWSTGDGRVATVVDTHPLEDPLTAAAGVSIIPSCGNGRIEAGEECDDGNVVSGDGCAGRGALRPCTNEGSNFAFACGNGRIDPGEECEPPVTIFCGSNCLRLGNATCAEGSAINCCGNGTSEPTYGEDCDDGNTLPGDGCSPRCLAEGTSSVSGQCGDGVVDIDAGEECDPAAVGSFSTVTIGGQDIEVPPTRFVCDAQTCLLRGTNPPSRCGNRTLEYAEECEDGNVVSGDGCSARCLREGSSPSPQGTCGNSRIDRFEDCDDGNTTGGDGCGANCLFDGTVREIPPRIDPLQNVEARGIQQGEETTGSTTRVLAGDEGTQGEALVTVFCSARTDRDCPAPGGSQGSATVGRGVSGCCYRRPQVVERTPQGQGVCRNAALRVSFNQELDPESLAGNMLLARRRTGSCLAGERELTAQGTLTEAGATPTARLERPQGFWGRLWQRIISVLHLVLPGAQAQGSDEVWCVSNTLTVTPNLISVVREGTPASDVVLAPSSMLGSASEEVTYRVAMVGDRDISNAEVSGLRSIFGVGFYGPDGGVDQSLEFTTGREVCTLDEVEVTGGTHFRSSGETAEVAAIAYTRRGGARQPISPAPGYRWAWSWGSADSEIVTVTNSEDEGGAVRSDQEVTAGTKDGTTIINATATITEDTARNQAYAGQCRELTASGLRECFNHPGRPCGQDMDCGEMAGQRIVGTATFSTLLCENPWPNDPTTLYRLIDSEENPLGGSRPTNFATRYCRDGATLLPELRYPPVVLLGSAGSATAKAPPGLFPEPLGSYTIAVVGENAPQKIKEFLLTARTFHQGAAVPGGTRQGEDTEENTTLRYTFEFPDDGDYELTLETSTYDNNSDARDDELSNLAAVLEAKEVPASVRDVLRDGPDADLLAGAYYHALEVVLDGRPVGVIRNKAVRSAAAHSRGEVIMQGVAKGSHEVTVRWLNDARLPSSSISAGGQTYAPGSIWDATLRVYSLTLRKGRAQDDAVGIRVMSNPERLSVRQWYDQMGFRGVPTPHPAADGYEAIKDGATIYVSAINVVGAPTRTVFGNIYIFSLSEGATPALKSVFDELIKNLTFNVNIVNLKRCDANFCSDNPARTCDDASDCGSGADCLQEVCSNDLDCAQGGRIACRADKDKLSRDLVRLNHISLIESALAGAKTRTGRYPTLEAGTFIRGMSTSRWPSWQAAFGAALGISPPRDPINRFGETCAAAQDEPGTYDPTTCWNERSQMYICPAGSYIYQYESRGGEGYKLSAEFELLERPESSPPTWDVDGWVPSASGEIEISTGGVCSDSRWSNAEARCGNRIIEAGEECEPGSFERVLVSFASGGQKRCSGKPSVSCAAQAEGTSCPPDSQGRSQGTCLRMTSCTAQRPCRTDCQWNPWQGGAAPSSADCAAGGTFCGNGVRDDINGDGALDEACDDGLLNGQYGKCRTNCSGLGAHCGDAARNGGEACDEGAMNGTYGHCRFDCTGQGERCGDGTVNGQEQCEAGQVQILAKRCHYPSTDPRFDQPCSGDRDCRRCLRADGTSTDTLCVTSGDCPAGQSCSGGECGYCGPNATNAPFFYQAHNDAQFLEPGHYPYQWRRACTVSCTWPPAFHWSCVPQGGCGNGVKEGGEQCDDGNMVNEDGCTNTCENPRCGDGFLRPSSEECDAGPENGAVCNPTYGGSCTFCDSQCNIATRSGGFCGDGIHQMEGEQCEGTGGLAGWVCQGAVGGHAFFWNFENVPGMWQTSGASISRVVPGFNSASAMKITASSTGGGPVGPVAEARVQFPDTDGKTYVASVWLNTPFGSGSAQPKVKFLMDRAGASAQGEVFQTQTFTLDSDQSTWQYIELSAPYDSGPDRMLPGRLRIQVMDPGTQVAVDQVTLRPGAPVCDNAACRRACKGGATCENRPRRCEGGMHTGAICEDASDCPGGICSDNNFDKPGSPTYLTYWPPAPEAILTQAMGSGVGTGIGGTTLLTSTPTYGAPAAASMTLINGQYAGDLVSNNCDNDQDNDGAPGAPMGASSAGYDCDDNDARRSPDAIEKCGDGIDNDCDGMGDDEECVAVNITVSDRGGTDDTFCVFLDGEFVDFAYGTRVPTITQLATGTEHQLKIFYHHQDFSYTFSWMGRTYQTDYGNYKANFSDNMIVLNPPGTFNSSQSAMWATYRLENREALGYLRGPAQLQNAVETGTPSFVCSADNGTSYRGLSGAGAVTFTIWTGSISGLTPP